MALKISIAAEMAHAVISYSRLYLIHDCDFLIDANSPGGCAYEREWLVNDCVCTIISHVFFLDLYLLFLFSTSW